MLPQPPEHRRAARVHRLPWRRGEVAAADTLPLPKADAPVGWVSSTLRSVYGLLQPLSGRTGPDPARVEAIRLAMLDALRPGLQHGSYALLAARIEYAGDLRSLWYLRSDLMAALSRQHGEEHARLCLGALSARFHGLIPEARSYHPRRHPR